MEGTMADSDKELILLPLCGSDRKHNEGRERRSCPRRASDLWHQELFKARMRTGRRRDRHTLLSFNRAPWLRSPQQHLRAAAGVLLCLLALIAFVAGRGNTNLLIEGGGSRISRPEVQLASGGEGFRAFGQWMYTLFNRRVEAQNLVLPEANKDLVTSQVNELMREFGAEDYSVPFDFVNEVDRFIRQYQQEDRDLIVRALEGERENMERVREIFRHNHMPEDLAYMALVESGLIQSSASQEGAAGFWQFTETTAREYGMKVEEGVDERLDLAKSTEAASRYLRDLILDFGSGSSIMLAMAAYNSGPEAVRRAVRNVKDPIKQRNFWYLYCTRALPDETREYVPKVFAAIIVGRNPRQFGF